MFLLFDVITIADTFKMSKQSYLPMQHIKLPVVQRAHSPAFEVLGRHRVRESPSPQAKPRSRQDLA